VAVTLADRRSGAIARLLASGRRSPERAIVEQSHCDTLSREPAIVGSDPVGVREGDLEHHRSSAQTLGLTPGVPHFLLGFGIGDSFPFLI
jgi:hypothetical protein